MSNSPQSSPLIRQVPEITFVPPPKGPLTSRLVIIVLSSVLVTSGVILAVIMGTMGGALRVVIMMPPALMVVLAAIFPVIFRYRNRAYEKQRTEFLEKCKIDEDNPLVQRLTSTWTRTNPATRVLSVPARFRLAAFPRRMMYGRRRQHAMLPRISEVRDAIHDACPEDPDRMRIICFGEADVPEVGDLHFEPEIITPTASLWGQFIWVAIALGLLAMWFADFLNLYPRWLPHIGQFVGSFAYFIVAGAMVAVTWIWRGMIRPRYIRMAPGVIQVLEYRFLKDVPTIRSYPASAGTLAVFVRFRNHLVLMLSRGEHENTIALTRVRDSKRCIQRAWEALLTTAPTPPLSDTELIG